MSQDALMFTSRPKFKNIIGVNYDIDDFGFLNNTTFGTTKFQQADFSNPGFFTTFSSSY
jgi:iron complex outermembrane receptor protein